MKALRYYGPGSISMEETPVPAVGAGEVLVAVQACGVCATDVKTFQRGHPKIQPGAVLGHEIVGVVVEAPGGTAWRAGQRVAVAPYVPCLECPQCRRKRYSLCARLFEQGLDPGGFSEFARIPARLAAHAMFALPDSVGDAAGCFAEPVACCLHAFDSIDVRAGDSLLVIGDGVMGLLQAALGKCLGASTVILSGMTPQRLELAAGLADVVIDARSEDLVESVRRHTAGAGVDKVIVSVAGAQPAQDAMTVVKPGGGVNLFAGMSAGSQLTVDMARIHYSEIALTGTFGFGPDDFRLAVDLLVRGELRVEPLVTSAVPLSDAPAALERASRLEGVKTIVLCGDKGPR